MALSRWDWGSPPAGEAVPCPQGNTETKDACNPRWSEQGGGGHTSGTHFLERDPEAQSGEVTAG